MRSAPEALETTVTSVNGALQRARPAVETQSRIAAVALAPLFTFRRTRRMDIPSTLRVME